LDIDSQLVASSPADALIERLDDPKVVASLNQLLDHADLLAVLVVGLDGLVSRGEVIGESLLSAVNELRDVSDGRSPLRDLDLAGLANSLKSLSGPIVEATPALSTLLTSKLTDPQAIGVISQLGEALVEGRERAAHNPSTPMGVFGLLRTLKDEDISRGLGFLIEVARSFGKQLKSD
jgi:hypothetical protein